MANKTYKIELTGAELCAVSTALSSVEDCMEWDEEYGEYTDGARFILALDKKEMAALKRAIEKI